MVDKKTGFASRLSAMIGAMAAARDRDTLAQICLDAACSITGAGFGCLWALDASGQNLVLAARYPAGSSADVIALYDGSDLNIATPHVWSLFTGNPLLSHDIRQLAGFDRKRLFDTGHIAREAGSGLILCPLRDNDALTVGLLELRDMRNDGGTYMSEAELAELEPLLKSFVYPAGIMIAASRLQKRNYELLAELNRHNTSLGDENHRLRQEQVSMASHACGIIANSDNMRQVLELALRVSQSNVPVLVLGETGVGKDMIVRLLHSMSQRRDKPLISQNCAALPELVLESEMFGFVHDENQGNKNIRRGLFGTADKGTLFLDKIADLSLPLQAKLLRVLEDGEICPPGADKPVRCDVRLVAASHIDLATCVSDGRFREDLFYRIAGFPIHVPPLRDRDDVDILAEHFLVCFCQDHRRSGLSFAPDVQDFFHEYRFPGNVRELRNMIERAVLLANNDDIIDAASLRTGCLQDTQTVRDKEPAHAMTHRQSLSQFESQRLAEALEQCDHNRTKTAEMLGISRRSLQEKIVRYGLDGSGK
ncbi:MAG: sigma 54-interacting transcriptional regulator [Acetobacter sp.]